MEYSPGVCRCCLAQGSFKRLAREYQWLGDREIYIVMLEECFGLNVVGGDESERLICEVCITRLRDAANFKKQVIVSEKYFQMSVGDSSSSKETSTDVPRPMLSSLVKVKKEELDDDYSSTAEDTPFEYEVPVKVEEAKSDPDEEESLAAARSKSKRRQTRKSNKTEASTSAQPDKIGPPTDTACPEIKTEPKRTNVVTARLVSKYECFECDVSFSNELIKQKHDLYHERFTDRPNRKCPNCGQCILSTLMLKHITVEHKQKPFVCEECGMFFISKPRLRVHSAKIHNRPTKKGYISGQTCLYCDEVFTDKYKRLRHFVNVHKEKSLQMECGACGKKYSTKQQLRQHHKRFHMMERKYKCEQCEFASFDKKHLMEHMITHTGEKKFRCEVCGKRMARARALSFHMRIHNNDKRKVCPVCGQAFVQKASLTYHITKHHPQDV